MKKSIFLILFTVSAALLWAMPPMPGSGLKHDGSQRQNMIGNSPVYSKSSAMDKVSKAKAVATTGTKKILVILAQFPSDVRAGTTYSALSFMSAYNKTYFENLLGDYKDSPSSLTMAEYYKKMSQGNFKLEFQVLGPYTATYDYVYYGENDIYGDDKYPATLVEEMLNQAKAESVDADVDNCTVIVVHAGPGEENGGVSSDYIWSHRYSLSQAKASTEPGVNTVTINGKIFDDYTIVPEYNITGSRKDATVGVFCHEFGHILGLVDSYDTSYGTAGVGQWSLMAGGSWGSVGKNSGSTAAGSDPAPLMAWERVNLGWLAEEDITPVSGADGTKYTFDNINDASKVYRINLTNDGSQYLTLEGKSKNMTGSGMAVMETGLLITQIHTGVMDNYWSANRINYGSSRVHGAMVVEAVASNYRSKGLGDLWRDSDTSYRFTTTALFRSDTLTSVSSKDGTGSADIPFLPLFISTIAGSGIVISMILVWHYGRRKLCFAIACAAAVACIGMSCDIGGGSSSSYDSGPNTRYYTDTYNVYSKTGDSGITIYDIQVNEDGSGSFWVKKE